MTPDNNLLTTADELDAEDPTAELSIDRKSINVLLYARSVRRDQTFDLYAQRIESIHRAYISGCTSRADADEQLNNCKQEIDYVKDAIAKAQTEFRAGR